MNTESLTQSMVLLPNAMGPKQVSVTLPLPPKQCSPNYRGQTKYRSKHVRGYRNQCGWNYQSVKDGFYNARLIVDLDFYLCRIPWQTEGRYFPQDEDSARASFKAGQDALQDAGWIKTDSHLYVKAGYTHLHSRSKEHKGMACVIATFTEW